MSRRKCVLDCDPGHDDLAAIMLAICSPNLDLQFISTSHGNQTVNKTYQNTRRILNLIKLADKIPVYRGFTQPLVREGVAAAAIHGESGLGGYDWSYFDETMPRNPVLDMLGYKSEKELCPTDFFKQLHQLINEVKDGDRFDIIAVASMTNIAQYIMAYPNDAKKIRVQTMGGNFMTVGNVSPFAEFNVLVDPEAYENVLKSDAELIFAAPLDITHTVVVTDEVLSRIRQSTEPNSPLFYKVISGILLFFKDSYKNVYGFPFPPLHDPVAVFYLMRPDLFISEHSHVDVETKGEFTYGCCCHDLLKKKQDPKTAKKPNAIVCLKLKEGRQEAFWNEMIKAFETLSKRADK